MEEIGNFLLEKIIDKVEDDTIFRTSKRFKQFNDKWLAVNRPHVYIREKLWMKPRNYNHLVDWKAIDWDKLIEHCGDIPLVGLAISKGYFITFKTHCAAIRSKNEDLFFWLYDMIKPPPDYTQRSMLHEAIINGTDAVFEKVVENTNNNGNTDDFLVAALSLETTDRYHYLLEHRYRPYYAAIDELMRTNNLLGLIYYINTSGLKPALLGLGSVPSNYAGMKILQHYGYTFEITRENLRMFIRRGDIDAVRHMLVMGIHISGIDSAEAVEVRNYEMLDLLFEAGAEFCYPAYEAAMANRDMEMLHYLYDRGVELKGYFFSASATDEIIDFLLDRGYSKKSITPEGAAKAGNLDTFKRVIGFGARITPHHARLATANGRINILEYIHETAPEAIKSDIFTTAIETGRADCAKFIFENGYESEFTLTYQFDFKRSEVVKRLLEADYHFPEDIWAYCLWDKELFDILLEKGYPVNKEALQAAAWASLDHLKRFVPIIGKQNITPNIYHSAIAGENYEAAIYLIDIGIPWDEYTEEIVESNGIVAIKRKMEMRSEDEISE